MAKQKTKRIKETRQSRKERKRMLEDVSAYENSPKRAIVILIVVLVIFFGVYFISGILTGEIKLGGYTREKEEATIQYKEIIMGEMFNRSEGSYYVLLGKSSETSTELLMQSVDNFVYSPYSEKVYYVDLENGFNKKYSVEEESNPNAQTLADLKVKGPTLVHIADKKIDKYIEGKSEIEAYFDSLSIINK